MTVVTSKRKKTLRKRIPSGKGLTFEKVWAMMQETDRQLKETAELQAKRQEEIDRQMKETDLKMQETERIIKENSELQAKRQEEIGRQIKETAELQAKRQEETNQQMKETDRKMQETDRQIKETDRIVKRNGKQMGELHRRFGQLAEHLVAPGITKRFNELGYNFDVMSPKGLKILDERGKIKTEIDMYLENGRIIMAVEIKTRPVTQDVEHHIKRLEILRDKRRILNDRLKIQGAIAGAIYDDDVKEAVREAGMYVIEQSGDTMKIDMPDGFIPREW